MKRWQVASVGDGVVRHALKGEWVYGVAVNATLCGRAATGVESMSSGRELEVTCKVCQAK